MSDKNTTIQDLKDIIAKIIEERDWSQFHTPSNIAKSIIIEAAELLEKFQWADGQKSKKILEQDREEVKDEVADIVAYLLSLCHHYDIDLSEAFIAKMKKNVEKYPIEKCKGKSDKYSKYY